MTTTVAVDRKLALSVFQIRYWQHVINENLKKNKLAPAVHLAFGHEAIATAVERVALDGEGRAALIERGLANARRFTWEAAARETIELLREVAHEPRATHRH